MSNLSIIVAKTNSFIFPETLSNDVVLFSRSLNQNIHLGHASTPGAMLSLYQSRVAIRSLDVANNLNVAADATIDGLTTTMYLLVKGPAQFSGNIIPSSTGVYNLGNNDNKFKEIFLSGSNHVFGGVTLITGDGYMRYTSTAFPQNCAMIECRQINISQSDTVDNPSYTWSNAQHTGLYLHDNNSIGMTVNGSNCVIVSDGAVTINGNIHSTGTMTSSSDARFKNDIQQLTNSLDKIANLRGVSFERQGVLGRCIGVIAQEVETILPEVVSTDNSGTKSVAYGNIVALLIEGIKELKQQNIVLTNRLNSLFNA
jgi:hypothetical protein